MSGGPLYDKENDVLVGVTSWGVGCGMGEYIIFHECFSLLRIRLLTNQFFCAKDHPGIWAKISSKYDWITNTVCDNHSDPKPSFCEGMTESPTVSAKPTPSPTSSSRPSLHPTSLQCNNDEMFVSLSLTTDKYGYETSWTIMEYATQAIIESDSYLDLEQELLYKFCLPCSQYEFNITDNYGDGLLSEEGYELTVDGTVIDKYTNENDGGFSERSTLIPQSNHCPSEQSCDSQEITLDIKHYGMHHGTELRWAVEDTLTGNLIHDRTNLKASQFNDIRLCVECGKYIFRVWNEYEFAASGGLAVSVDGNILRQYNLLYDVGILNSTEFTSENCPTYQRLKSAYKYLDVDFCMEPKKTGKNAPITVKPCSDAPKQLWKADKLGQFHAYNNDNLCITKNKETLKLKPCLNKYTKNRGKSFAYSYFTKQLIWMRDARIAVTMSESPRLNTTVTLELYRNNNALTQQWIIEDS